MPSIYTQAFSSPVYNGKISVNTGLFINGQWVDPIEKGTIEYVRDSEPRLAGVAKLEGFCLQSDKPQ